MYEYQYQCSLQCFKLLQSAAVSLLAQVSGVHSLQPHLLLPPPPPPSDAPCPSYIQHVTAHQYSVFIWSSSAVAALDNSFVASLYKFLDIPCFHCSYHILLGSSECFPARHPLCNMLFKCGSLLHRCISCYEIKLLHFGLICVLCVNVYTWNWQLMTLMSAMMCTRTQDPSAQ